MRISSPAAWILSGFQVKDREGRSHAAATPIELYVLTVSFCILSLLFLAPKDILQHWIVSSIATIFIIEICQVHAFRMLVRPIIDRTYVQYNFARTMVLTLISYQSLISLFALIYVCSLSNQFNITGDKFNSWAAWSLSVGILTGTGYSGIVPTAGTVASLIGGIESIIGIFFLTTIIGLALTRVSARSIEGAISRGPHLVNFDKIRSALIWSGKAASIDLIQNALQTDVWVTGGWIRSAALEQEDYDGDIDLLVDNLTHDELEKRLTANNITFVRGRLGGFKFSPTTGVNIDCFSTRTFGPAVSIQEAFAYFNATINAAAFKFSDPDTFLLHPQFQHDALQRLLRILPNGLRLQPEEQRAKSMTITLQHLVRDNLALVTDPSTRELVRGLAPSSVFAAECKTLCKLLDAAGRHHEAEVIRGWLG